MLDELQEHVESIDMANGKFLALLLWTSSYVMIYLGLQLFICGAYLS